MGRLALCNTQEVPRTISRAILAIPSLSSLVCEVQYCMGLQKVVDWHLDWFGLEMSCTFESLYMN